MRIEDEDVTIVCHKLSYNLKQIEICRDEYMTVKLIDICDIQYGYAFDSANFTDDEKCIPLVRIRDVKRGYSETFFNGSYPDEYILHKGDLLIGMDGEFNIARWQSRDALLNQRVCKITACDGTSEEYLRFALSRGLKEVERRTAFVTVKHLSAKELNKLEIDAPPLAEQEYISGCLSKIEKIIELRENELKELDELIKARFVEMFDTVKDTCDVGHYIQSLIAGKSLAGEEECQNKVLKTGAASFDYFDSTQVKNLPLDYEPKEEHLVNHGDIIISRMNTSELTGAAAYVWDVPEKVYLPDRLWKAKLYDECNPIFVWQMLIQPSTKEQIRRECSGTSGSMKNISKKGLLGIKVKKVGVRLQDQFAEFVKQVDKSKVAVQRSLDESQLLFDSLMQKYFG